jgi:hypothetical protein
MNKPGQKREMKREVTPSKRPRTNACSADCPVLVVQTDSKDTPSISLFPELDDLLHPLTGEDFLENYFRKKAVHVTCKKGKEKEHAEQRVAGLRDEMFGLDAEMILRETSSENIFLWLQSKENKNEKTKKKLIRSIEVADVDTAISLHKIAKHPTYCRAPPNVEQSLVASLLKATGKAGRLTKCISFLYHNLRSIDGQVWDVGNMIPRERASCPWEEARSRLSCRRTVM